MMKEMLYERMKEDGWKNSYCDPPPKPGIYEVCCVRDYAFMRKTKMKYCGNNIWYVGGEGIDPNYWREIKK